MAASSSAHIHTLTVQKKHYWLRFFLDFGQSLHLQKNSVMMCICAYGVQFCTLKWAVGWHFGHFYKESQSGWIGTPHVKVIKLNPPQSSSSVSSSPLQSLHLPSSITPIRPTSIPPPLLPSISFVFSVVLQPEMSQERQTARGREPVWCLERRQSVTSKLFLIRPLLCTAKVFSPLSGLGDIWECTQEGVREHWPSPRMRVSVFKSWAGCPRSVLGVEHVSAF